MTANQKSLWNKDRRAQVGIGTMIVFIATILVAATAAAVLLDTSGRLQERSSSTGNEATQQVASNLVLLQAYGSRVDTDSNIDKLNYTVTLAPGASSVDLQQLKIRVSNSTAITTYSYTAGAATGNLFSVDFERDHDDTTPVMTRGDLVNIQLVVDLPERAKVTTIFMPEVGSQMDASFNAPNSFGSATLIPLR